MGGRPGLNREGAVEVRETGETEVAKKESGAIVNISARTVEFHKCRIIEVTGRQTRADFTRCAIAHGMILVWYRPLFTLCPLCC